MSESRPQQKEIRVGESPPLPLLCADRDHLVAHRVDNAHLLQNGLLIMNAHITMLRIQMYNRLLSGLSFVIVRSQ